LKDSKEIFKRYKQKKFILIVDDQNLSKIISPEIPVQDVESIVKHFAEEDGMLSSVHFFSALFSINKGSIKDKIYIISKAFSFGEDEESLTRDEFIACLTATAVGIFRMVENSSSCPSGEDIEKMAQAVFDELSRGDEVVDISEIVIWAQNTFHTDVDITKTFIAETSRYALLVSRDEVEEEEVKTDDSDKKEDISSGDAVIESGEEEETTKEIDDDDENGDNEEVKDTK
jgi:hypothetical protein